MPRYRRLPYEVDAMRVTDIVRIPKTPGAEWEVPDWVKNAFDDGKLTINSNHLIVQTAEGPVKASRTNWLIRDDQGEFTIYKKGGFLTEFELIPEEEES